MELLELLESTVTQGFIYSLLCFGIFISYKLLDFHDLSVDGSFPLGAAVTAVMLTKGINPYLTLLLSALAGALAGFATGLINVKLKVRDLLSGIITMTALFSINLQIAGSNLNIGRDIDTIFVAEPFGSFLGSMGLIHSKFLISLLLMLIIKAVPLPVF